MKRKVACGGGRRSVDPPSRSQGDAAAASAQAIDQLEPILYTVSPNPIKEQIRSIIPEYTPYLE